MKTVNMVMMSIPRYNQMLEALEDNYDEQLAAELEKESKINGVSLEDAAAELGVKLKRSLDSRYRLSRQSV